MTSKNYKSKRCSKKDLNDKGDAAVKQERNIEGNTTVQVVQSSISSPSVVTTNYENVSSVVVEPVELAAAGEAQAELDECDEQVLQ
ncbi:unnamed protein product [Trichobilharzia regenti]|nr:unnamed protein product [Trichobilharzia regenti]